MVPVTKMLYPTDFSSYSNQAYLHAVTLAETHGAALTILFVLTPDLVGPPERSPRDFWQEQLRQIRPLNPSIPVEHLLLEGDPATEIVRHCEEAGIDLVVMGTHGRTGVERLLMGSVAERVLRDAPCSVLIVKLPSRRLPVKADVVVKGSSDHGEASAAART